MIDFKRCPDGMPCSGNCMPFGCQRDARPAASESDTPETDALVNSASCSTPLRVGELIDFARSLERRLSQEKKLSEAISRDCNETALERNELRTALSLAQTEIKGHMRIEDDLKRDLGLERESHEVTKRMLGDRDGRIAALERVLRDLLAANPRYDASAELDAAIDAALKDRA